MTIRTNILRERFASGKPTLGTHIFLPEPAIIESIGHTGVFDYIEFLAEYNAFTLHDLDAIARTAELMKLGSMIKLDWELNRYFAHRSLGSGIDGVLFADPRGPEDVAYCVASLRPDDPVSRGSYGASARRSARPEYGGSPDYIASIMNTVVGIMIETPTAFDTIEAVLATPGIDFVQWGPADFAMRSGFDEAERTRRIPEYEKELIRQCDAAGVPYRIELWSLQQMRTYADQGALHFSIGYDLGILQGAFQELGDGAREILEEYS